MSFQKKQIADAASAYAKSQLGEKQYASNADARQAIEEDFTAGAAHALSQVEQVLATRRDAAYQLFTQELEDNGPEGSLAGAEAGEAINKIASDLGIAFT